MKKTCWTFSRSSTDHSIVHVTSELLSSPRAKSQLCPWAQKLPALGKTFPAKSSFKNIFFIETVLYTFTLYFYPWNTPECFQFLIFEPLLVFQYSYYNVVLHQTTKQSLFPLKTSHNWHILNSLDEISSLRAFLLIFLNLRNFYFCKSVIHNLLLTFVTLGKKCFDVTFVTYDLIVDHQHETLCRHGFFTFFTGNFSEISMGIVPWCTTPVIIFFRSRDRKVFVVYYEFTRYT